MPLYRKLPKRGFKSPDHTHYEAVNIARFSELEAPELTPDLLRAHRLVRSGRGRYKVLGQGDISRACVVHAHAFSKTARAKIEAAGGRCEVIG